MKARNTAEAWNMANEIFRTDYTKDDRASQNAGYPVYWSTLEGNNAWISDLGNRLEVNQDGRSINIWIEEDQEEQQQEEQKTTTKDFSVYFQTETRKGSQVITVKMETRISLGAETTFGQMAAFFQEVKKIHSAAMKAVKRGDWFEMDICEAVYDRFQSRDPYKVGRLETVSFDCWKAAPTWEQSEDGIYFRPDTRYTSETRDMYLSKKDLFKDLEYTLH